MKFRHVNFFDEQKLILACPPALNVQRLVWNNDSGFWILDWLFLDVIMCANLNFFSSGGKPKTNLDCSPGFASRYADLDKNGVPSSPA